MPTSPRNKPVSSASVPAPAPPPAPKSYKASGFCQPTILPPPFLVEVRKLEQELQMPVCLLVQNHPPCQFLERHVYMEFFRRRAEMPKGSKVAVILDSPGGHAAVAYKLAKFFRQHCGGFIAVVPSFAKSAATLLVLGAEKIIIGEHAELGPLDAQETDDEEGEQRSVLNSVQTLERLNAFAMKSLDEAMQLLLARTGLKMKTVLPYAIRLASNLVRPLMENIDVVRYTETSRILKVAEEYAIRLLQPKYNKDTAGKMGSSQIRDFPAKRT
jgi:hypothetical protein